MCCLEKIIRLISARELIRIRAHAQMYEIDRACLVYWKVLHRLQRVLVELSWTT